MAINSLPRQHVSVSQINTYTRCPAEYYFRYIEGVTAPLKPAMYKGSITHSGIEFNYRQKIDSRQDLPIEQVKEYTSAQFDERAEEVEWDEDKGKAKDETLSLLELYHKEIAPSIQPVAVEERAEIAFVGKDYTLLGYIDVVDENGFIRDTKTTGRTPSEDVIDNNLQLAAYSLMYRTLKDKPETGVALDYLVSLKKPKVVQFQTTVEDNLRNRFLKIMDAVVTNIENGNFYPNHQSVFCGKKCPYYQQCIKEW